LSNHLGNVLVTISDKKIAVASTTNPNEIAYYNADVITASDYYPGGMTMPGRKYSAATGYRYGFNGKENDKDAGEGIQDYGMRIYDARLGRFLSVDPIDEEYPELTPYQFASNSPIENDDMDGLEARSRVIKGKTYTVYGPYTTAAADEMINKMAHVKNRKKNSPPISQMTFKQILSLSYLKSATKTNSIPTKKQSGIKLSDADLKKISDKLSVEPAAVLAVATVESSGSGFWGDKPKLRFEGHYFKKILKEDGFDVKSLENDHPDLLYNYSKNNTKVKPHGYSAYNRAIAINEKAGMMSASWGAFQIMGVYYKRTGYKTVQEFVAAQNTTAGQTQTFINFVASDPYLLEALKNANFTNFARGYNGPKYKDNNYDEKMQKIYDKKTGKPN
jgi:RHS repeat-associated protein